MGGGEGHYSLSHYTQHGGGWGHAPTCMATPSYVSAMVSTREAPLALLSESCREGGTSRLDTVSVARCAGHGQCGKVCWTRSVWQGVLDTVSVARCAGHSQCGKVCWTQSVWQGVLDTVSVARCAGHGQCGKVCWTQSVWQGVLDTISAGRCAGHDQCGKVCRTAYRRHLPQLHLQTTSSTRSQLFKDLCEVTRHLRGGAGGVVRKPHYSSILLYIPPHIHSFYRTLSLSPPHPLP